MMVFCQEKEGSHVSCLPLRATFNGSERVRKDLGKFLQLLHQHPKIFWVRSYKGVFFAVKQFECK